MSTTIKTAPIPQNVMALDGLIAVGLTVSSTSTPSLNGTYLVNGIEGRGLQAEATAILLAGATPAFADGTASLNWPDKIGGGHTFTPAQFLELVRAVNLFLAQCAQYSAGLITALPSNAVTIA